ncbi:MAG: hypothetical protein OXU23_03665 [Candidatus Poribacteria bacterium]|nr:hypothetical protein [Candidatus Poribacteria bacterium]
MQEQEVRDYRKVEAYRGGGKRWIIVYGNSHRSGVYEMLDCDDNESEFDFMAVSPNTTLLGFGVGIETIHLKLWKTEICCQVKKTDINPLDAKHIIPHFRIGLERDAEREAKIGTLLYREHLLGGEMKVYLAGYNHYRYVFERVDGDIIKVSVIRHQVKSSGIDPYRVRAFFEEGEIFRMNFSVEPDQYFANLNWYLGDMYEVGLDRG